MENEGVQAIELEIRSPVSTSNLALLRNLATAVARQAGFNDQTTDEIEMAVDEACANVVRHAYKHLDAPPGDGCRLVLRIVTDDTAMEVCVIDEGIGGGCDRIGRVGSVEEFEARGGGGGLGTLIIHRFMDEVEYTYPEKGTMLVMKKYLPR